MNFKVKDFPTALDYAAWEKAPEAFWAEKAKDIRWSRKPDKTFDPERGAYGRWFPGGELNITANCLDRHIEEGFGEQAALIWDSAVTGVVKTYSYRELGNRVAHVAGALAARGIGRGDRVVIYMPMIPEAMITMLACARLGAIHCVVYGGFAAGELARRIDDAKPRAIISASCGIEPTRVVAYKPILDAAIDKVANKPEFCLIFQRPMLRADMAEGRDFDYESEEANASPHAPVIVPGTDPLYILYTSGTTGVPKGIVTDSGGYAVAMKWSMWSLFGMTRGKVFWCASDVGWVIGHSYLTYAPLLAGCTTVLFEGKPVGTPDASTYWRVISQHRVAGLFTAPSAFRAIRQFDNDAKLMEPYDLSAFEHVFIGGERCDVSTAQWIADKVKRPVLDVWGQTETNWCPTHSFLGPGLYPPQPGAYGRQVCGYALEVLDRAGNIQARGESGNMVVKLPLPPGCGYTLWSGDKRYSETYLEAFPGWYVTGDAGRIDSDGHVWLTGRTDDIINISGHRLSTNAIEEVLASHADIAECVVIGVDDELKGESPFGFAVLKAGVTREKNAIERELVTLVRDVIGPVAAFKRVMLVKRVPRTRSGKVLRVSLRQIAEGKDVLIPPTIDDPAVIGEIREMFAAAS